jgi:hypothetical protein
MGDHDNYWFGEGAPPVMTYIFQHHQKQNTKIFREEQSRA